MDIAEDTGLIIPMGVFVMREACAAAVELREATGIDIEVSINLSVRQLDHPSLPGDLEDALRDSGVDPAMIELEITESALMSDVDASAAVLNVLKALGTRVAVDDFGTGYSSLQYLQSLPVDVLKVDRTFVSGLGENHGSTVITSAVIRLSSALGLVSVAEGVETPDQLARLRALGCNQAQGFHIARPMPIADLIELIQGDPTW
jgi:EAL domain-containing protein (putative c-di-GMP-specific phosphodiesterase class I)